jgi:hypothetical protein
MATSKNGVLTRDTVATAVQLEYSFTAVDANVNDDVDTCATELQQNKVWWITQERRCADTNPDQHRRDYGKQQDTPTQR